MSRRDLIRTLAVLLAALALLGARPVDQAGDVVWSRPDLGQVEIGSIAFLPVVTLDDNPEAAAAVEQAWPRQISRTGHQWLRPTSARELLRGRGAESLVQEVRAQVKRSGALDSATALRLARVLHTRAFLVVRVDTWHKHERDPAAYKARPSSTTVGLRAALVDSTGTLLWSISGKEVASGGAAGPAAGMGIRPGELGIGVQAVSTAPAFDAVLSKLLARWKPLFPTARVRS